MNWRVFALFINNWAIDYNKRLILLSVIPLSGGHCNSKNITQAVDIVVREVSRDESEKWIFGEGKSVVES
jgi:hypothetical protein